MLQDHFEPVARILCTDVGDGGGNLRPEGRAFCARTAREFDTRLTYRATRQARQAYRPANPVSVRAEQDCCWLSCPVAMPGRQVTC